MHSRLDYVNCLDYFMYTEDEDGHDTRNPQNPFTAHVPPVPRYRGRRVIPPRVKTYLHWASLHPYFLFPQCQMLIRWSEE